MADLGGILLDTGGSIIDQTTLPIEVPPIYTPPIIDTSTLFPPIAAPTEPFPGAPVVEVPPFPPPAPITLEPPPIIPYPPPVTVPLPQPGLPPIGYDAAGNPIYSVNNLPITTPNPPPLPPGPVINAPPPVVQTSSGGTAVATAIASINQNIQILNQDIVPLVQGIKDALAQSAQTQADIAQNTANQISQSLGGFTNGLFGWVRDLFDWLKTNIGHIVEGIANVVKNVAEAVFNAIKTVGEGIANWFKNTVGPVLENIGKEVIKIDQFYQQHIEPILRAIAQIQQVVSAAIVAIQKDIAGGLQGILKLPTDLANAFSSIDQALIRAGRALRVTQFSDIDLQWRTGDGKTITDHLKQFSDSISGKAQASERTTYAPGPEHFTEPTLAQELPQLITAMNTIFGDIVGGVRNIIGDPAKLMEAVGVGAAAFWFELLEPFEALVAIWEVMKQPLEVVGELAAERVREITQLTKLDPSTLVAAWRRNLLDQTSMDAELSVQGYNADRRELLRRLSVHVEDVSTLVEYLYRGVVTGDDFNSGLRDLGFTDPQIQAVRDGTNQLLDIQTALAAWRRGDIDESQVDAVFAVNRWNEGERDLLKVLTYSRPSFSAAFQLDRQYRMMTDLNLVTPVFGSIPKPIVDAGHTEGLSDDAILAQWIASYDTLPAGMWLQLYWRGQAGIKELQQALFRDKVHPDLQANWVDAQRPLIPFRTIPGMIAAGIMTDAEGLDYLQRHGYSLEDAVRLLEYAKRGSKMSKASTAASQHDISLAQAKNAYQDGVLTRDQYLSLLKAHGLDDNAASLEIELVDIAEETKNRKQIGIDIINEYQAGLINQEQAFQQVAASGYTLAEQAAVIKKLAPAAVGKVKLPSEAELRAFASHGIITPDDYQNRLVVIGYTAEDAANFRQLHFPVQ